ncbi:F-BAR domain only protein 2 isoform X2 [Sarcophilus harrisii]|uniref:F-BAR domain only protein 2 isoform X2 n=1 Tax=Sarcophilus harrisii TaxID=9305 RepID=UPI001301D7B9|nr:F-BAR domain only protein 2 isoform X2 [Sarcophilus harrisii]
MVMAHFVESFWGERNSGFDVLYHNMKHGQISTKELADFVRERATIEEAYSRSMTKLAKSASNYTQLGTFAPVWDVFKSSTEKLASCHLELVRKLQELIKEVQKYGEEQVKSHKKTKEEVAGTLEAVQNIQSITQALQKSKENYNAKCLEQERLKKEGATQREIEKAAIKSKKATDTYKLYVEKYATAKSDFEQKMTETAQKFQDIEETHLIHIKEIIESLSKAIQEIHLQIGQIHEEFINNMANTTVEGLIQKFAESKGTGKERPGLIEFEECDAASVVEGIKPRKRKTFALSGIIKKEKDAESVECPDADSVNIPDVDEEGYSIKPEANQNDTKENHFYSSSDSDSEDEEPKKYRIEIKPVHPNNSHHTMASLDELKVSIGNISLSPAVSVQMNRNSSSEELTKSKLSAPSNEKGNNDLLVWDPLFGPSLDTSNSTQLTSAILKEQNRNSSSFPIGLPGCIITEPLLGSESDFGARSPSPDFSINSLCHPDVAASSESTDVLSFASWSQSQWISFTDELVIIKHTNADQKAFQRLHCKTENVFEFPDTFPGRSSNNYTSEDQSNRGYNVICPEIMLTEETESAAENSSTSSSISLDSSIVSTFAQIYDARPTTPLSAGTIVPPPRPTSRPKLTSSKLSGINEIPRPFSPPVTSNTSPPPAAPLARAESTSSISSSASLSAANTPTIEDDNFIGILSEIEKQSETSSGVSRGPSPVSLGNQDTLPVAVALTESVNAYFKGADPSKCIVKITGDMTVSFPSGIIKVFTSNPSPAVLCFRVKNTSKLEQILPNAQLIFSDPSQCDSSAKDFWMNMQAVTVYLKKLAEQNPSASYYNVDVLKYQVSSNGIQSTPLNLATYWKCNTSTTDVRVDYKYNPEAMIAPSVLSNIQVVVPVDGGVTNMQSLPPAVWNAEQMKAYWKLSGISEKSENGGSGSLRAKFDLSEGPSKPTTLAVQFISEGSTLSGADIELLGTGYRLSLIKKRFATGRYLADC